MSDAGEPRLSRTPFPTTQWSRVVLAGDSDNPEARQALAELFRDYWYPLYAFVRRKGYGPDDAADLVQGLLTSLLERSGLSDLAPARGRFRSYLMVCCNHYLSNRRAYDLAAKRGGGRASISIEGPIAERRLGNDPSHDETPERVFDRQWALTLLGRVLHRLDVEASRSKKALLYQRLRPMLEGDDRIPPLRQIAAELGLSEGAVRVAAHRLRARYGELLREEIARTTGPDESVEDEIASLLASLAS